jgi:hypothetical protein
MRIIDKFIPLTSRSDTVEIYPFGDCHIGSRNCAETPLRRVVKEVENNPLAFWIGGGDLTDCIKPQDVKRFDVKALPNWLFKPSAEDTKEALSDILYAERERCVKIFEPIKDKCLGLIEGNHEQSIRHYYNDDYQQHLCDDLGVKNLTDEALIRLRFKDGGRGQTVIVYIRHGWGGSRKAGGEPNKLADMIAEWEIADICFTGHSHSYCELPPKPVLTIPRSGELPTECDCHYRWGANWGCWLYSHSTGPSTYESRACYPSKPMLTVKVAIQPFWNTTRKGREVSMPKIELRTITL